MFKTLVVALDLEADGDRALPVVQALARSGHVAVDLVTVCTPGLPTTADAYELERRAQRFGWDPDSWTVVVDVDAAGGLVQHAARRDDALIVMATSAHRPKGSSLLGSVARDVLRRTDRPVLLIGPHVPTDVPMACTTLVPCVGASDSMARAVPAIVAWQETFTSAPPQLAAVLPTGVVDDSGARQRLAELAGQLAARHVPTSHTVVFDDDPITGLDALAAHVAGPVYVATSARYTDGRLHWHSTTQRLVQRAACPVLVVPARRAPAPGHDIAIDEHVAFHDVTAPALP